METSEDMLRDAFTPGGGGPAIVRRLSATEKSSIKLSSSFSNMIKPDEREELTGGVALITTAVGVIVDETDVVSENDDDEEECED